MVVGSYTAGKQGALSAKAEVPEENVGLLLVVDTREHISTAVVVKSVPPNTVVAGNPAVVVKTFQ